MNKLKKCSTCKNNQALVSDRLNRCQSCLESDQWHYRSNASIKKHQLQRKHDKENGLIYSVETGLGVIDVDSDICFRLSNFENNMSIAVEKLFGKWQLDVVAVGLNESMTLNESDEKQFFINVESYQLKNKASKAEAVIMVAFNWLMKNRKNCL
jgi:hypothetical protein